MKSIYFYKRGNHSENHVRTFGSLIYSGSNKKCDKFMANLRKEAKAAWRSCCTNLSMSEFVAYDLEPYFVYDD